MKRSISGAVLLVLTALGGAAAQPARFEDVVRNLRNPDARVRMQAVRLLREAQYPEAIIPLAPLVNDPVEAIQLEAIAAELSFFLVQDVPERRRIGFVVEVRGRGGAEGAFEAGPLALWPKAAPPELVSELLKAVDDEDARVRREAIHAVGLVARPPLPPEAAQQVIRALDHYDPAVRAAAAKVAGRLEVTAAADVLLKAINDSDARTRYAAMLALGALADERAVSALTAQLEYYDKGEGAWSALDGLARIAHPSSIPQFTARLADRDPNIRRAAAEGLARTADASSKGVLETGANTDPSAMVRAAMTFALQRLGGHYIPRLAEFLNDGKVARQVQEYLIELGPPIERELLPILQEPDPAIRAAVADVLGAIGAEASLAALKAVQDSDRGVVEAASRAVTRLQLRGMP